MVATSADSGAGAYCAGVAGPPHGGNLDDVATLRRLNHLVAAQIERDVVDRVRIAGVGRPEHQVAGPQVGTGHLRQRRVLRPAVARDRNAGPKVGVLGQTGAVEADDAGVEVDAQAGAVCSTTTPGV